MKSRSTTLFILLSLLLVILFFLDLLIGSVHIPLCDILGAIVGADIDPATRLIVLWGREFCYPAVPILTLWSMVSFPMRFLDKPYG